MGEQTIKSTNITAVESRVTLRDRIKRSGHRGGVLWLTGLSGSGKSTDAILKRGTPRSWSMLALSTSKGVEKAIIFFPLA